MLITRDGPVLRPGTRSYARSWIRDGAMMSESLLRIGPRRRRGRLPALVRAASVRQRQGALLRRRARRRSGARARQPRRAHLPRRRGPRYTPDRRAARATCGRTSSAAARYLESLRQSERIRRQPDGRDPRVLRPAAAVDQPRRLLGQAHDSYWDDFWALTGYDGAIAIGDRAGPRTRRPAGSRRSATSSAPTSPRRFATPSPLTASPICPAPPTSAISTRPRRRSPSPPPASCIACRCDLVARHVRALLARVRRAPRRTRAWEDYTPYEMRNVGTFVRLGWRERAHELLEFFHGRSPPAGLEPVGRGGRPRRRASRASSATCRTAGSPRTSSARCSTCSPTSATATTRSCSPPACPRPGSREGGIAVKACARPTGR